MTNQIMSHKYDEIVDEEADSTIVEDPVPLCTKSKELQNMKCFGFCRIIKLIVNIILTIIGCIAEIELYDQLDPLLYKFIKHTGEITIGGLRAMIIVSMVLEYIATAIALCMDFYAAFSPEVSSADALIFGFISAALPLVIKIIFAGFMVPMYAFDVNDGDIVPLTAITADEASLITSICVIIFIIGLLCIPCKYDACYLCVCISTVGFCCGLIAIIGRYQYLGVQHLMQEVLTGLFVNSILHLTCLWYSIAI